MNFIKQFRIFQRESLKEKQPNNQSLLTLLRHLITRRDKINLLILLFLSIILSIIETSAISLIMPFIAVATMPDMILSNAYLSQIYHFFSFENTKEFVFAFGVALIAFYLFRAIYNICYYYLLNRFSYGRYSTFAQKLFQRYTQGTYINFVNKNSAILIKVIFTDTSRFALFLNQLLMFLTDLLTILLLFVLLIITNWKMTLVLIFLLGLKVLFIIKSISRVIKKQGKKSSDVSTQMSKDISETIGNFKFIKLKGNEKNLIVDFSKKVYMIAKAYVLTFTLSQAPKVLLELVGFSALIGCVLYILYFYGDPTAVLPIISMYALALYRMLPAVARLTVSYSQMLFASQSLEVIAEELAQPIVNEGDKPISFNHTLEIKNLHFGYLPNKEILKGVSLTINRGEKVAFIGESGSGKSTLIDLIIGVFYPKSGEILVDNVPLDTTNIRSWRKKIGYIPQSIYLFDGTVTQNVAFGSDRLDREKVKEVLKKANMLKFLEEEAQGIDTLVGEGGIKLSGGQKQRIGIARALYDDPEILVLDEATSALDTPTETKIMEEIYEAGSNKTLLIIAHRLSTVEQCDRKITLSKGVITNIS